MKVTEEVVGYKVSKVTGSQGQFGRSDSWGVIKLVRPLFDGKPNGFPPQHIIISHHNSKAAAEKKIAKYV